MGTTIRRFGVRSVGNHTTPMIVITIKGRVTLRSKNLPSLQACGAKQSKELEERIFEEKPMEVLNMEAKEDVITNKQMTKDRAHHFEDHFSWKKQRSSNEDYVTKLSYRGRITSLDHLSTLGSYTPTLRAWSRKPHQISEKFDEVSEATR
ncbi:hypothetical protein L1987_78691 [Smallanthus sonchifolius]|uniref:Uncharacterized protein n=1 Tax=Smallanthus sonchifolius TaxID=185202 RepID=A0ACB8ZCG1_9ASTR|nr:hypothetical protein L1987_78691 [Smallanthus sonchifolius]